MSAFLGPGWIIVYITGAYTAVSVLTLWTIRRQVQVMIEQTRIAQAAAAATERSAVSFVNAERSRLLETVRAVDKFRFEVSVTNTGRSPARLTHAFVSGDWLKRGEQLPTTPDYKDLSDDPEFDFLRSDWVLPGAKTVLGEEDPSHILDADTRANFESGELTMWIYGRFRYEDSISGEEYEARFCYHASYWGWLERPLLSGGGPVPYRGEHLRSDPEGMVI